MTTTNKTKLLGYNKQTDALEASRRACATPRTIELTDGSYAGVCDNTIETVDGRTCVRAWAMVPSGCVEVAREDGPGLAWEVRS